MVNNVNWFFYKLCNKLCKVCNITFLFKVSIGVKACNNLLRFSKHEVLNKYYLEAKDLYLGFDALSDEYTLLDTTLLRSPHYEFMELLENNKDYKNSDYIHRTIQGTLDFRNPQSIDSVCNTNYNEIYKQKKIELEKNIYNPVVVYKFDNKYYIADGKHRAAMCAVLGKKINCSLISNDFLRDSYRQWIFNHIRDDKRFLKHNRIMNLL